jgi:hypothetical protein
MGQVLPDKRLQMRAAGSPTPRNSRGSAHTYAGRPSVTKCSTHSFAGSLANSAAASWS